MSRVVLLQIWASNVEIHSAGFELAKRSKKALKKVLFLGVNGASNFSTPCTTQKDDLLVKLRPQASVGETRFRKVVEDD